MKNKKLLKRILMIAGILILLCVIIFLGRVAWLFLSGTVSYSDGFIYRQY